VTRNEQLSLLSVPQGPDVRPPETYGTNFQTDPTVVALADLWVAVWNFSHGLGIIQFLCDNPPHVR